MVDVKDRPTEGFTAEDASRLKKALSGLPERTEPRYSGGASSFFSTKVNYSLLLILAMVNDFYDFYTGFGINPISLGIDVFTFAAFALAGFTTGMRLATLCLALLFDIVLPGLLTTFGAPAVVAGALLFIPWWTLFSVGAKYQFSIESKAVDALVIVGMIVGVFLLNPFIFSSATDAGINQRWIYDTTEATKTMISDATTSLSQNYQIWRCTGFGTGKSQKECETEVLGLDDSLSRGLKIDATLNTGFRLSIDQFTQESVLVSNEVPTQIGAENNLQKSVLVTFACGLEGRGAGTIKTALTDIPQGVLPLQQSTVLCQNLDISRRGTTTFYFNATVHDVASAGYRDIILINNEVKNAVLSKYPGISENTVLEKSQEFGAYIKERQDILNARVGKDDLIQPIIKFGPAISVSDEFPLIFGIDQESTIPFTVFIKNNGKGTIKSVKTITFTLPQGFSFDEDNCDLTANTLTQINWKNIGSTKIQPVAHCNLKINSPQLPNNPRPESVAINVVYDYAISKGATVSIPQGVTI